MVKIQMIMNIFFDIMQQVVIYNQHLLIQEQNLKLLEILMQVFLLMQHLVLLKQHMMVILKQDIVFLLIVILLHQIQHRVQLTDQQVHQQEDHLVHQHHNLHGLIHTYLLVVIYVQKKDVNVMDFQLVVSEMMFIIVGGMLYVI